VKKLFFILGCVVILVGLYTVKDTIAQVAPYFYDIFIYGSSKAQFRDSAIYINSSTDGQLDIDADTEIEITTTTVDMNAALNVSSEIVQGTGFWADCPLPQSNPSGSYQYFTDFVGQPLVATTNALEGWLVGGDASYVVASTAGTLGGIITLTPATGSNNEVEWQMGELNTDTYLEYTASSGLKSWVEYRFTTDAVTDAGNIFLGLAEEASAAADFINDTGADIADKDVVGFIVLEASPQLLLRIFQTAGGAFDTTTVATLVAGTYVTAGIYFNGVSSVSFYVNGTSVGTTATTTTLFPDTEELSPLIAVKNGAADKTVSIDWIKMVVQR